ncbi:MAG: PDZ domain-containing protein, partial [Eubacteriales bacterium]|nr:PDZ domain-containing protein [Eubacteriales bacterium]
MGTGAEIAGLEQGDIITKADGQEIKTIEDLNKIKNSHKPGESIQMEVYKYETGLKKNVSVRLGEERPE